MKIIYDIVDDNIYGRGKDKKVFIYEDDIFIDWMYMDDLLIKKNIITNEKAGNSVELKNSYKKEKICT